jgi:hypothetical protein
METITKITSNPVYKKVLADSFGGVMYNVANRDKYDTTELVKLWNSASPAEKESAGGILKGAMHFLTEVA